MTLIGKLVAKLLTFASSHEAEKTLLDRVLGIAKA